MKYTPVVEILEVCKPAEPILRKSAKLHEAAFIAVTTLHNNEVSIATLSCLLHLLATLSCYTILYATLLAPKVIGTVGYKHAKL